MPDVSRRSRTADRGRDALKRQSPTRGKRRRRHTPRRRDGRAPALAAAGAVALAILLVGPLRSLPGLFGLFAASSPTPAPALQPPAAPRLVAPVGSVTGGPSFDLQGLFPEGLAERQGLRIRVYVGGELARQRAAPPTGESFVVEDVPVPKGWSELTATLVGAGGESAPSGTLRVLYDTDRPELVLALKDGQVVNAPSTIVRGTTQEGSTVTVWNERSGDKQTATVREGRFSIPLDLRRGTNRLTVSVVDPAGNRTVERLRIVRGNGRLTAQLSISAAVISADALPRHVSLRVAVSDPDGKPVDDARVTFSISVPGLPTSTYEARTKNGTAAWPDYVVGDEAVAGDGFATVLVQLPDGKTARDTVRLRLFSD
jgi:Glucodextranase, domain B